MHRQNQFNLWFSLPCIFILSLRIPNSVSLLPNTSLSGLTFVKCIDQKPMYFPAGARLQGEKVRIVAEEIEKDEVIAADSRTAKLLKEVANTAREFTKMEVDSPSENHWGWMPIIDNKARTQNKKVDWSFCKKKCHHCLGKVIISRWPMSPKLTLDF